MTSARNVAAIACLAWLPLATAAELTAQERQLLDGADARILQHRTSEVTLRLSGPDGAIGAGAKAEVRQVAHRFLFGSNIFALGRLRTPEHNAAYEKHFAELLNYATLPFYWWAYEAKEGQPDYKRTRQLLAFCRDHRITPKGHPLAWNYVDPKWLPEDPRRAIDLQLERIERDAREFAGQINLWDVVNEATEYDREMCRKASPTLTAAIEKIGVPAYVRRAFEAAHKGSPKATRIINDYITDPRYAEKVIKPLVDEQGRPLYEVIGIQSHQHGGAWPVAKIWEVCERHAAFKRPLHFTETTFVSGEQGWDLPAQRKGFKWVSTPEGEQRQARDVERFYTMLFSHPTVEAITWWDFSDQGSWQGAPAGFLRDDMTPKPAYERLKALIKGKWWTSLDQDVAEGGTLKLRCFHGTYEVTVRRGEAVLKGTFEVAPGGPTEIKVSLR